MTARTTRFKIPRPSYLAGRAGRMTANAVKLLDHVALTGCGKMFVGVGAVTKGDGTSAPVGPVIPVGMVGCETSKAILGAGLALMIRQGRQAAIGTVVLSVAGTAFDFAVCKRGSRQSIMPCGRGQRRVVSHLVQFQRRQIVRQQRPLGVDLDVVAVHAQLRLADAGVLIGCRDKPIDQRATSCGMTCRTAIGSEFAFENLSV